MSDYRGCPYCNHMEPFRYSPTRCGNCGGMMIPDVEEVGEDQCVSWLPESGKPRDWQVLAIVSDGAIEIDCNSGEKRLKTHAEEKAEQKQSGEYRAEDWDE